MAGAIQSNMADWEPVSGQYRYGDGLLMRILGQPVHVGFVIDDKWFLHCERGTNTCLEKYTGMAWRRRIIGAYRHKLCK